MTPFLSPPEPEICHAPPVPGHHRPVQLHAGCTVEEVKLGARLADRYVRHLFRKARSRLAQFRAPQLNDTSHIPTNAPELLKASGQQGEVTAGLLGIVPFIGEPSSVELGQIQ